MFVRISADRLLDALKSWDNVLVNSRPVVTRVKATLSLPGDLYKQAVNV